MYDPIAAIITPPGRGPVGIIRLSGLRVWELAGMVFTPASGKPLPSLKEREVHYGALHDLSGHVLDHGLAFFMKGPRSYTGEDVAELQCHGSPAILSALLTALYDAGARPARPGEFTKRAFLNGRLDLTQAEAVVDLISSETADAAQNAAGQLDGVIGRTVGTVYDDLTEMVAHFGALVDYPEEDIQELGEGDMAGRLREHAEALASLADTYKRGRLLRDGVRCAIIGRPNVGKSSLLNALLGYDRAIVTETPGTTRDTLEENLHLGGVLLKTTDTAGLREETGDEAESLGVRRAKAAARAAELVLIVLDGSRPLSEEDRMAMDIARGNEAVLVINKCDLPQQLKTEALEAAFLNVCRVSALNGQGLDLLDSTVRRIFESGSLEADGSMVTNLRHADCVARAALSLSEAAEAITAGLEADVVLTEVEGALDALGEMTGRRISEEIIQRIFDRFCVGK